ncbi:MAG TPA: hypothetical protein VMR25_03335 [Planctomycetaceae bacterium]|nr:hypothetical protein [Planctomycetaceae bacterium]
MPIERTTGFASAFVGHGTRDKRGRSWRDLDLKRRLFKYPCSYLVYSAAFDALPGEVKDYVYKRLWDVLSSEDTSKDFAHLTAADRQTIIEILRDTKPGLPGSWKSAAHASAR